MFSIKTGKKNRGEDNLKDYHFSQTLSVTSSQTHQVRMRAADPVTHGAG